MSYRRNIGSYGEDLAVGFLKERGYRVVARNYSCRYGEIDIVAVKGGEIHFVEVKTRTAENMGRPEEAVGKAKKRRMNIAAARYMAENRAAVGGLSPSMDVIAIEIAFF